MDWDKPASAVLCFLDDFDVVFIEKGVSALSYNRTLLI